MKQHAVINSNGELKRVIRGQGKPQRERLRDGQQIVGPDDVDISKLQKPGKKVDPDTMTVVDDPSASVPFSDSLADQLESGNISVKQALVAYLRGDRISSKNNDRQGRGPKP